MKRRDFLIGGSGALIVTAASASRMRSGSAFAAAETVLAAEETRTLDAVLEIVLPKEPDSPGASDIRAREYIESVLADPRTKESDRTFLLRGIRSLEKLALEKRERAFSQLSRSEQEELFQAYVDDGGESWVASLIASVLEALFGDPVYGGNVNEVGWKWIEHTPGFPRPPRRNWERR